MKIILAVVCITFVYIFSMVNLEAYRNQQLNKFDPNINHEEHYHPNDDQNKIPDVEIITKISVTIIGQIDKPGTYTLNSDATLDDLIKLGGLNEMSADESCYNRDLPLQDKMTYYIPKETDFKVSINNALAKDLMMLNGIGQATADRIVKYRNDNGGPGCFECIDDIKKVPGIKELTFNKIRDYIKL